MSTQYQCATIGCAYHACRTHAHCRHCRYLRRMSKRNGINPDTKTRTWLDGRFGRTEVAA